MKTEPVEKLNKRHVGRNVQRVRRLRGMSQTELGDLLGVSKQAVSKMEHTKKINDERLEQISDALGVTREGLKTFAEEAVLYSMESSHENSPITGAPPRTVSKDKRSNPFLMEQNQKLFEELIRIEKETFESLKKEKE